MMFLNTYFREQSLGLSLLLKSGMLAFGSVVILCVGWPEPSIKNLEHVSSSVMPSKSHSVQEARPSVPDPVATLLDLNASTRMDLERLPGIGAVLADRIVSYRSLHGAFQQVDDLVKVSGIGGKRLRQVEAFVKVGEIVRNIES
jgi:competence protein ComEA